MDRKYIQKLLSSIKKKYRMNKSPQFRCRLEFRKDPPRTEAEMLPTTKFYRPPKANGSSPLNHEDTIEDGEIIDEKETDANGTTYWLHRDDLQVTNRHGHTLIETLQLKAIYTSSLNRYDLCMRAMQAF